MDQLLERMLAAALCRINAGAIDVAVEILTCNDVACERTPRLREFNVLLFKDDPTGVVLDRRFACLPLDRIKRVLSLGREDAVDCQAVFNGRRS